MANKLFPNDYVSEKSSPVDADILLLSDTENANIIKRLLISTVKSVVRDITGLSSKSSLVDADILMINDSADSNNPKKILSSAIKDYISDYMIGTIQNMSSDDTVDNNTRIVEIDASAKQVIVTLPDRATVINQTFYFKNKNIGFGLVQRAGSDVIGENSKTEIPLYWEGDYLELFAGTTRWEIKRGRSKITGRMRNCSDWTNAHLASIIEVDIDNGSSPDLGFEIGEIVTESTSGYEARIYDIIDNADGTGTLWLYDCDGNLTDGRTLTGNSSSATADVNESSGSTKNLDTNFRHNFGEYLYDGNIVHSRMIISSDGTYANSYFPYVQDESTTNGADVGWTIIGIDNNSFQKQSGAQGIMIHGGGGSSQMVDTEDYYFIDFTIWNYGG